MAEAYYVPLLISTGLSLITSLFAPKKQRQKAPDPNLRVPKSDFGSALPRIYGKVRIEGNKFWPDSKNRMFRVETTTEQQGGKGGGGGQSVETKIVYGTFAILFSTGEAILDRIIINGNQIEQGHSFFQTYCTFFDGSQTAPWSEIVAKDDGNYKDIAYKGINYLGFKDVPLTEYGNTIPSQVSAVLIDKDFGESPTIAEVVGDMCKRAGVPDELIDVTELEDLILKVGLIVAENGEGYRKILEELMGFYLFTAIETKDGKIKFKKFDRTGETPLAIPPEKFLPDSSNNVDNKLFSKTTESKTNLPNKLVIKYSNENQNYDSDEVVEFFEEYYKENSINIDSQLISYPYEVRWRARLMLRHLYLQQRNIYNFSLPSTYLKNLELLDLVELPNGEVVQLHQSNLGADFKLDLVAKYYGGNTVYSYEPEDDPNIREPPVLNDPTVDLPEIYILDIPQIEDYPPSTLYCCATAPCTVQLSFDLGLSYPRSWYHQATSTIGNVVTVLADGTGDDFINSVEIELESGSVESITLEQFNLGYGLGLIGKNPSGAYEGELILFKDVEQLSPTRFRLSYLKRGQFGTQPYASTHSLPEKFFLLKHPVNAFYSTIQAGNASFIGETLYFRPVVAPWQNLALTPVTIVNLVGNSYKPPAPTNVTGILDIDGNMKFFWEYDPRFSPYNDSQETVTFEVEINNPFPTVVRTLESPVKNVFYLIAESTLDGVTAPVDLTVYAVSSVVGRGYPARVVVIPTLVPDSIFGTGQGLKGIKFVYADYTVLEEDNNYIIIVVNPNPTTITLTFPETLTNGFFCYVISEKSNNNTAKVQINCLFTYTGAVNNIILTGNSVSVQHISEGKYFVFGNGSRSLELDAVVNITGDNTLEANKIYEVIGPATLLFPPDPVEGSIIGIIDSPGTFPTNNVLLDGNGYNIEGAPTFLLKERDENIQFYFNGFQWIYITRFYYVDVEAIVQQLISEGSLVIPMLPSTITTNYTLLDTDYKKWIRADGNITITVMPTPPDYFEAIIQNIGTGTINIAGITNAVGNKITTQWEAVHVYFDGTTWTAVGALSL